MHKRRLFLLFFAAMSLAIMIMLIVYGLFLKDIDFNLEVKNPEIAPSPVEAVNQETTPEEAGTEPEEDMPPANVQTPDQAAANNTAPTPEQPEPVQDIVPLESPTNKHNNLPSATPQQQDNSDNNEGASTSYSSDIPSLHYVYLDGFSTRGAAETAIQQLQDRHLVAQPYIRQYRGQIILQFGVYSDKANADVLANQLRRQQVFVKVD